MRERDLQDVSTPSNVPKGSIIIGLYSSKMLGRNPRMPRLDA